MVLVPKVVTPAVLVRPPDAVRRLVTPSVLEKVALVPVIAPIVLVPNVVTPPVLVSPLETVVNPPPEPKIIACVLKLFNLKTPILFIVSLEELDIPCYLYLPYKIKVKNLLLYNTTIVHLTNERRI
jgi:hypothetical protein